MVQTRPRTRLYCPQDLGPDTVPLFDRAQMTYLVKVLRLKSGASIGLFNERDGEWAALLQVGGARHLSATMQGQICAAEPATGPVLAFAPIKKTPLEWLLIKATELGARHLQPVVTDHSQATLGRVDRLRGLLVEATEQCERCTLPSLAAPVPLRAWLPQAGRVWIGAEAGPVASDAMPAKAPPDAVLVGPEGGFSATELALFAQTPDLTRVSLGPRILRAETAGLSLLVLAQLAAGEFAKRPAFRP